MHVEVLKHELEQRLIRVGKRARVINWVEKEFVHIVDGDEKSVEHEHLVRAGLQRG